MEPVPPLLHLVFLTSQLLLTKKPYTHWTEIQAEFNDYKTSLGPWTSEEVIEFLQSEYPEAPPFSAAQIQHFMRSPDQTLTPRSNA